MTTRAWGGKKKRMSLESLILRDRGTPIKPSSSELARPGRDLELPELLVLSITSPCSVKLLVAQVLYVAIGAFAPSRGGLKAAFLGGPLYCFRLRQYTNQCHEYCWNYSGCGTGLFVPRAMPRKSKASPR